MFTACMCACDSGSKLSYQFLSQRIFPNRNSFLTRGSCWGSHIKPVSPGVRSSCPSSPERLTTGCTQNDAIQGCTTMIAVPCHGCIIGSHSRAFLSTVYCMKNQDHCIISCWQRTNCDVILRVLLNFSAKSEPKIGLSSCKLFHNERAEKL